MRLPTPSRSAAAALLLPALVSANATPAWNCETTQNGLTYDFTSLAGKHELLTSEDTHPNRRNTTWQINPCGALPKPKDEKKLEECPAGSWVCALRSYIHPDGKADLAEVYPIAGELDDHKLDPNVTLFGSPDKTSGLRVTFHGAPNYLDHEQSAVIEFVCDESRTGLEGSEVVKESVEMLEEKDQPSLKFVSYVVDDTKEPKRQTLNLQWRTKQACEKNAKKGGSGDKPKEGNGDDGSSWGFFTWVFIISFLCVAAYLIFQSWLNYNRYNARGWDLLPHSDTIRDIPYLFQDFMRRVKETLQGRNSRVGYSAV
ncbi:autophagy protein [Pyronema domesticum]|uniref:Autophagy-related protein 27 n=1 Tax=Pyronema omphalodes (strain CBS 100304) TaxID=1076935 RepID=U4LEM1_PYROM|nr:autophagy protein [Pyronema domesticum]CCX30298.1 Similar to Autophagy-related protein 27; acc. no. Q6CBS9 [Pyronema omphalodes CBS 100304]